MTQHQTQMRKSAVRLPFIQSTDENVPNERTPELAEFGPSLLFGLANAHKGEKNGTQPFSETSGQTQRSILGLQHIHGNRYVQRVLALARHGEGETNTELAPEVESAIQRERGCGQTLDGSIQRKMESAFGADFSGVRVHTNREAHSLNDSVNAIAFTTGQDIFFRDGAYDPSSSTGRKLLAHELTHVVQQTGPGIRRKLKVSEPDDACEVEAEQIASSIVEQENQTSSYREEPTPWQSNSVVAMLDRGFKSATTASLPVAGLLNDALSFAKAHPYEVARISAPEPTAQGEGRCSGCGSRLARDSACPKCRLEFAMRSQTEASGVRRVQGGDHVIAREVAAGGRTRIQCINANLANAGIPWAVITILGGVCGILGAIAGLAGGPAAPAAVPSGMAMAAAVCIAAVTGLAVGTVLGVIIRCCQDPSVEWVFAQNEGGPSAEGSEEVA